MADMYEYAKQKFSMNPQDLYLQKQSSINNQITAAEQNMYRSLGLEQQQREADIRKRRQQALKSGATSAQLAAQELQTALAGQEGAMMAAQQFETQRAGLQGDLSDYALNLSSIDAQRQASDPIYQAESLAERFGIGFNDAWQVIRGEKNLEDIKSPTDKLDLMDKMLLKTDKKVGYGVLALKELLK